MRTLEGTKASLDKQVRDTYTKAKTAGADGAEPREIASLYADAARLKVTSKLT